jgi:hypothetical protein
VGDTHIVKRKLQTMSRDGKSKKVSKERPFACDDSTPSDDDKCNSTYVESGDNSSASLNGDTGAASNTSISIHYTNIIILHICDIYSILLHSHHLAQGPWYSTFVEDDHEKRGGGG